MKELSVSDIDLDSILASIHGPLGNLHSTAAERQISAVGQEAAVNLLNKAVRALAEGDEPRAAKLVVRAAALPYDHFEMGVPAALVAHMMLFDLVTDEAENSDESDSGWLDAALDVLEHSSDTGRAELQHVLGVIDQDYAILPPESRRIRQALDRRIEQPSLRDLPEGAADLASRVLEGLAVCLAYERALEKGGPRRG